MKRLMLFFGLCLLVAPTLLQARTLPLTTAQALQIGVKIWYNEAGGTVSGLTYWNRGEHFASVGIGHFLWYPKHANGSYKGSFPALIRYMQAHGVVVPAWLVNAPYCPWANRAAFQAAQHSPRMLELRHFLANTVPIQVAYMVRRLDKALPLLLANVRPYERPAIREAFFRVASAPAGLYALMDYINFKGFGTNPPPHYTDQGWGLLQVLQEMPNAPHYMTDVQAFTWAANNVLTYRVKNAPRSRHEERWLAGWRNRLMTYLH